jgi:hypothetical protein
MPSIGFIAYASAPDLIGDTIEAALDLYASRQEKINLPRGKRTILRVASL